MDIANLFKGQKQSFECPNCNQKITIDASELFKKDGSTFCPSCKQKINFDNDNSVREIKDQLNKLLK